MRSSTCCEVFSSVELKILGVMRVGDELARVTFVSRHTLAAWTFARELSASGKPGHACWSRRSSFGGTLLRPVRQCTLVPYNVPVGEETAMAITASEARKNLFPLIEQVNDDRQPVEITSKRGDAVLMSRVDYDALQETAYLLRVPANARRLLESLRQSLDGQRAEHEIT